MVELASFLNRKDRMLADLRELVELESPSDDKPSTDRLCEVLAQRLRRGTGGRVEVLRQSARGNHLRVELGVPTSRTILVLGHFDTVWPVGTLASMPFRVDGGRVFGPGVLDMKAGIVIGIHALESLQESNELKANVVLLLTSDEEMSSTTSRALIEAEGRRADAALVLEPAAGIALKTARKGVGLFRMDIDGVAGHSGSGQAGGESAITELAHQILVIDGLNDAPAGTTLNVGVINGGTRANVIAEKAEAEIDVRVSSATIGLEVQERLLGLRPRNPKARVLVSGGMNRPPMERTAGVAFAYGIAQRVAKQIGIRVEEASVGGASDANFLTPIGIPVLDGLGAVGDGAHGRSEYVEIASLSTRAALLAGIIAEMQAPDGGNFDHCHVLSRPE